MYPESRMREPTMKIHVFPFEIKRNLIDKIWPVEFTSFEQDIEHDYFTPAEENRYSGLLRPDGLLRPCNDICRRSCRHF
jgi:hypothetical protein